jgi:hypothetical protein
MDCPVLLVVCVSIVDGESSKETSVDSGMPQGTVPGPIMFLCHIK